MKTVVKHLSIKLLLLSILVVFNAKSISAQNLDKCEKITNKEALKLYSQALANMKTNHREAYKLLQKAISIAPKFADAYFILAEFNYKAAKNTQKDSSNYQRVMNYFNNSEKFFNKVVQFCPSTHNFQSFFYLGEISYNSRDYQKAKERFDIFLRKNTQDTDKINKISRMMVYVNRYMDWINNPVPFEPIVVKKISTEDDEYLPLVSADGELIFYTHRYKKNTNFYPYNMVEEFSFATKTDSLINEDIYTEGEKMPQPFNDGRNQGGASITLDNSQVYITICEPVVNYSTSYNNCDIYSSEFVDGKWTPLKKLGPQINGNNTWEGQPSISPDGKLLYFASARENSLGELDIFYSTRDSTGGWSNAKNMGRGINTKGNDKSPFIHSDGQTLYFSSDGRFGLGGFDIYNTRLNPDSTWSEPVNLGYPINTKGDEVGCIVSGNGKKMYFSSNSLEGIGGYDVYSSFLYDDAQPKQILFVKGQVHDNKGDPVNDVTVELRNLQTQKTTQSMVDKISGRYAVAVPLKKDEKYILTAKRYGYLYSSTLINTKDNKYEVPTTINIEIQPIEEGLSVPLENVNFAFNSSELDSISYDILDNLVNFLNENKSVEILILGHTDSIGSYEFNFDLSERRAKAVYEFLLENSIDNQRLSYKGFGEYYPLTSNQTEEGRAENRRTEFIIVKK